MTTGAPEPTKAVATRESRRVAGKPFAIAFGAFLVVGTLVFYYFAQRAEIARQHAIDAMEADGALPAPAD